MLKKAAFDKKGNKIRTILHFETTGDYGEGRVFHTLKADTELFMLADDVVVTVKTCHDQVIDDINDGQTKVDIVLDNGECLTTIAKSLYVTERAAKAQLKKQRQDQDVDFTKESLDLVTAAKEMQVRIVRQYNKLTKDQAHRLTDSLVKNGLNEYVPNEFRH